MSNKTKKITVRFSKRLKTEMQTALVKLGYGLHGKSRWLNETVILFLKQPNFVELVEHGIDINQAPLSDVEAFYMGTDILKTMKAALVTVRIQHPLFEGVQSALIRAAVIYRLMLN